ncbi:MAG: PIN domain-containing protein [Bryobacterales bacterium]|nr:PIN domain-containing protein [Bryobacterales bacterium]
MTALPCDDLVAQIAKADVPVLLLDTCTILDVVRAPLLDHLGIHDIDAAHTLISRATGSSPGVSMVITEQVHQEFREKIDAVEKETCAGIKKATDRFVGILKRMQALSPEDSIPDPVDLLTLEFPQRGRYLAERIVDTSSTLTDHDDEVLKAYDRVKHGKPPATRAKQSVKDCMIAESYLRLAATLHTGGFSRNMVFATSNTKDYQQGHSSLHPELRAEFRSACLEYSPSWSAARHELDRCSTGLRPHNFK